METIVKSRVEKRPLAEHDDAPAKPHPTVKMEKPDPGLDLEQSEDVNEPDIVRTVTGQWPGGNGYDLLQGAARTSDLGHSPKVGRIWVLGTQRQRAGGQEANAGVPVWLDVTLLTTTGSLEARGGYR